MKPSYLFLVSMIVGGTALADGPDWDGQCAAGDINACLASGYQALQNSDNAKAQHVYEKACALNSAGGCQQLGVLFVDSRQPAKAVPLLQRGCDGNLAPSCLALAKLYKNGEGVAADAARAAALEVRGKKLSEAVLADQTAKGKAADAVNDERMKKDPAAFAEAERKCRAAFDIACNDAALLYVNSYPEQALELVNRSPLVQGQSGFIFLALTAETLGRNGLAAGAEKALNAICDRGSLEGCGALGYLYSLGRWGFAANPEKALAALERGAAKEDETILGMLEGTLKESKRPAKEIAAVHARLVALRTQRATEAREHQKAADEKMAEANRLENLLAPFVARLLELNQERLAQSNDRMPLDRLDPGEAGDRVSSQALETGGAWTERRRPRQAEIEALYNDIDATATK